MHANTLRYIGKLQLALLPGVIITPFEKSAYSIHIPSKSICKRKSWTICHILRIFNNRVGILFFYVALVFCEGFLYLLLFILLFYFLLFCFVLVFCSLLCLSTSVVINKNIRTLIWSISFTNTVHNMPKFW